MRRRSLRESKAGKWSEDRERLYDCRASSGLARSRLRLDPRRYDTKRWDAERLARSVACTTERQRQTLRLECWEGRHLSEWRLSRVCLSPHRLLRCCETAFFIRIRRRPCEPRQRRQHLQASASAQTRLPKAQSGSGYASARRDLSFAALRDTCRLLLKLRHRGRRPLHVEVSDEAPCCAAERVLQPRALRLKHSFECFLLAAWQKRCLRTWRQKQTTTATAKVSVARQARLQGKEAEPCKDNELRAALSTHNTSFTLSAKRLNFSNFSQYYIILVLS